MTPKELSRHMASRAEDVARYLLPAGKRVGSEWRCGSVCGEPGDSMGVHLAGEKAGVWGDFAEGQGGDLLDLWCAVRRTGIGDAMQEIHGWLGIAMPRLEGHAKQFKPPQKPQCAKLNPLGAVMAYLTGERKLTPQTLLAYRVAEQGRYVIFPFLHGDKLVMCKQLGIDRENGKKDIRPTSAEQMPILFGWQAISQTARSVAICEGEIDAMTLHQYGRPALSVPFGGGGGAKQSWIENDYDNLERFDEIFLCFDNDDAGRQAVVEIAKRLGGERCRVVTLPHKDANECLQEGVSADVIESCFVRARTLDPKELKSASEYVEDVVKEFLSSDELIGFPTPWRKADKTLRFRPGEVTVIAGVNAHGKSEGVGHLTLEALRSNVRACIASLEFKPQKWLKRLTRQASGVEQPTDGYIRAIHNWYQNKLWVFDVVGVAKAASMIDVFGYAVRRYGVRLFVIDNMSKLDISVEDYEAQRVLMDRLTDFAKQNDAHVFLVTHLRKSSDDETPAGKMDVKGSGAITDLADTVLIWWRNRTKEKKIGRMESSGDVVPDDLSQQVDAICICEKQRNGEAEPQINLWFDRASHQFLPSIDAKPWNYVRYGVDHVRAVVNGVPTEAVSGYEYGRQTQAQPGAVSANGARPGPAQHPAEREPGCDDEAWGETNRGIEF